MRSYLSLLIAGLLTLGVSASIHAKPQGQLNLLYWQAPSTMNPNLSGGTKELEASSVVLEPLARYDEKGNMICLLYTSPSPRDGLLSRMPSSA